MEQNILHYRIAEKGKMHALDKNHKEALRHYREAMRLTQKQADSEVFFQHYGQCVMESLELSGAYDEVISFCENYRSFLKEKDVYKKTLILYICDNGWLAADDARMPLPEGW